MLASCTVTYTVHNYYSIPIGGIGVYIRQYAAWLIGVMHACMHSDKLGINAHTGRIHKHYTM